MADEVVHTSAITSAVAVALIAKVERLAVAQWQEELLALSNIKGCASTVVSAVTSSVASSVASTVTSVVASAVVSTMANAAADAVANIVCRTVASALVSAVAQCLGLVGIAHWIALVATAQRLEQWLIQCLDELLAQGLAKGLLTHWLAQLLELWLAQCLYQGVFNSFAVSLYFVQMFVDLHWASQGHLTTVDSLPAT